MIPAAKSEASAVWAALATKRLARGDTEGARVAALLAWDGGECPFVQPVLAEAWNDMALVHALAVAEAKRPPVSDWMPRSGGNAAARAAPSEDAAGLDL